MTDKSQANPDETDAIEPVTMHDEFESAVDGLRRQIITGVELDVRAVGADGPAQTVSRNRGGSVERDR